MATLLEQRVGLAAMPVPPEVKEGVFVHVHSFDEYRDFEPVGKNDPNNVSRVTLVVGAEGKDYISFSHKGEPTGEGRGVTRAEALRIIETGA